MQMRTLSPTESDDDSDADMDGPMYKPVVTLGCWDAASQWEDLHPSGALLLGCRLMQPWDASALQRGGKKDLRLKLIPSASQVHFEYILLLCLPACLALSHQACQSSPQAHLRSIPNSILYLSLVSASQLHPKCVFQSSQPACWT